MGVDLDALKKQYEEHQEEQEKKSTGFKRANRWRPTQGSKNAFRIAPPHDKMNGIPYQRRGVHRNCGPQGDKTFSCLRDHPKEPVEQCPQCIEVATLFSTGDDAKIKRGQKKQRKQRFVFQGLDMSSFVNEQGKPIKPKEVPECFGNYVGDETAKGFKRCKKCVETPGSWGQTCMKGVCTWNTGPQLYEPIMDQFDLQGDVTDVKTGQNIIITQKGKDGSGREKYTVKGWVNFELPKPVIKWMNENLTDLTRYFPPKSKPEIEAIMAGIEYEEDLEDADLPQCFGDINEFKEGQKKCKECEAFKACKAEVQAGQPEEAEESEAEEPEMEAGSGSETPDEGSEEEEETVDLDEMDRNGLKLFIKDNSLPIKVHKGMSDDDIRLAIVKELQEADAEEEPEEEEPEEEEEEEEAEPEEESEEEDPLEGKDRAALKAYIKENNLDITVYKNWDDDRIREEIKAKMGSDTESEPENTEESEEEQTELEKALAQRRAQRKGKNK